MNVHLANAIILFKNVLKNRNYFTVDIKDVFFVCLNCIHNYAFICIIAVSLAFIMRWKLSEDPSGAW